MRLMAHEMPASKRAEEAESNGISRQLYHQRIAAGWTHRQASTISSYQLPVGRRPSPVLVAAEEIGLDREVTKGRLARGWSPWEALTIPFGMGRKRFWLDNYGVVPGKATKEELQQVLA